MNTTLRILNLEDNANDAELNGAMLLEHWPRCQITRVQSRDEYIAAIGTPDMDLILSDYSIPGFDGQGALALAREKCPQIPFLFVSGTIGEEAAIEALKNGATDYVLKQHLSRLVPAVERALREVAERAEVQRAEEAMRQSEHKYRELFECLGEAAFLTDERSGKIIDTNRRAIELLGCPRENIIGQKQSRFLAPADQEPSGSQSPMRICELIPAHGPRLPVEVRATQLALHGRTLVLHLCHESAARPIDLELRKSGNDPLRHFS